MPWRLVLLWLCIALLPLRGWAFSSMQAPVVPAISPTSLTASATATPCHGAVLVDATPKHDEMQRHAHGQAAEEGDPVAGLPAAGACALCDICHASAALPSLPRDGFASLDRGAPRAWTSHANGLLAVHDLFRPPRA